jgi:hypothetical protein
VKRLELWADEPDRKCLRLDRSVISLEPYRRDRHEASRREAYDEGTAIGFFLGLAAAGLVWLILSGALLGVMIGLVGVVVRLATGSR